MNKRFFSFFLSCSSKFFKKLVKIFSSKTVQKLILVSILVFIIWRPGLIFDLWDFYLLGLAFQTPEIFNKSLFIWGNDFLSTGRENIYTLFYLPLLLLQSTLRLFLNGDLAQAVVIALVLFSTFYFPAKFFLFLLPKNFQGKDAKDRLVRFLFIDFYMILGLAGIFILFWLLPNYAIVVIPFSFCLFYLLELFYKKKINVFSFDFLFSFFFLIIFSPLVLRNPPFVIPVSVTAIFYWYFFRRRKKSVIFFASVSLLHAFCIFPLVYAFREAYFWAGGDNSDIVFKHFLSSSTSSSILRLFGLSVKEVFWRLRVRPIGGFWECFLWAIGFFVSFIALFSFLGKRRRRIVLFWGIVYVLSFFLIKGLLPPFGIFSWVVINNVPFGGIFRFSIEKIWPLFFVSISTLFVLGFSFISDKKTKKVRIFLFLIGIILFLGNFYFLISRKIFRTPLRFEARDGSGSCKIGTYTTIPDFYFDVRSSLGREESRIVSLPLRPRDHTTFNWPFSHAGVDFLGRFFGKETFSISIFEDSWDVATRDLDNCLRYGDESHLKRCFGIFNIGYLFFHKDINENCGNYGKRHFYNNQDLFFKLSKMRISWEKGEFFDVANLTGEDFFLPRFYIPLQTLNFYSEAPSISEIFDLVQYEKVGIYLNKARESVREKQENPIRKGDEVFVVGENLEKKKIDLLEKDNNFQVFYPYIKHQPGSLRWRMALLKEKYDQWKVRKDLEKLIEKKLFYANKRMREIEEFPIPNFNFQVNSSFQNLNFRDILLGNVNPLQLWWKNINEAVALLDMLEDEKKVEWAIKIKRNIEDNLDKLQILNFRDTSEIKRLMEKLEKYIPKIQLERREYEIEVPKEGLYTLFLRPETPIEKLEVDGREVDTRNWKSNVREDGWIEWGRMGLEEGRHIITLYFDKMPNLFDSETWQIRNWQPNSWYRVKGKYKIDEGDSAKLIIEEEIRDWEREEERGQQVDREIPTKLKTAKEIVFNSENDEFEFWIKSDKDAISARIYLESEKEKFPVEVEISGLEVVPLWQPALVLRNKAKTRPKVIPKITFVKVNPTKYRIRVEGAKEPYTLVFSESFHRGWKLYLNQTPDSKSRVTNSTRLQRLGKWVMRVVGGVASRITDLFLDDKGYGNIVASYFNGEVKEGTHRMTFLEPATFETWGREPIAEDRHYLVNGYANSWYITPADVGGQENYELIVEFWPQRLFYIGLGISGMTLISCLAYLIFVGVKEKRISKHV